MKAFLTLTILITALITTYVASSWSLPKQITGAQLDPLPALMLVVALRAPITTIAILAIFASLTQSALSSNPLGISLLVQQFTTLSFSLEKELKQFGVLALALNYSLRKGKLG